MCSYNYGKDEVCAWIRHSIPAASTILDVGPCDGKWRKLLKEYPHMDACEIFEPNADAVRPLYESVFVCDIAELKYDYYDFVIFGDVIEHMPVEKAQAVLAYAEKHCRCMMVSVPWLLHQDAIYGNPYEYHVQDDLTRTVFEERYPGFTVIWECGNYAYFCKWCKT